MITPVREGVGERGSSAFPYITLTIYLFWLNMGGEWGTYHKTQISPLVQEVAVDIDAIRLAKIASDQRTDAWEVGFFQ